MIEKILLEELNKALERINLAVKNGLEAYIKFKSGSGLELIYQNFELFKQLFKKLFGEYSWNA